jgi:mRNA-degrading endonuclease toxin of MazEF toxin-antitoxin module
MQSGTVLDSGEVVLVPFPFTDLSQIKRRPVLVLSNRNHNKTSRDFICCGITSNLGNRRNSVLLDPSEMADGMIPVRSRVKYDKVFTLESSLVLKVLGKISQQKLGKVKRGLISLLG